MRGNCDSEVDQMVLDFPIGADYALLDQGSHLVFITHGHVYHENNLPPLAMGDVLLHGHTHVQVCRQHDTYTYLNPGSVAIPKEDSFHGYMILEDGEFVWKRLEKEYFMQQSMKFSLT